MLPIGCSYLNHLKTKHMAKTAMMELIAELEEKIKVVTNEIEVSKIKGNNIENAQTLKFAYLQVRRYAKSLLDLEKKQIVEAYEDGIHQELNEEINYTGETYYTQTYNPIQ